MCYLTKTITHWVLLFSDQKLIFFSYPLGQSLVAVTFSHSATHANKKTSVNK